MLQLLNGAVLRTAAANCVCARFGCQFIGPVPGAVKWAYPERDSRANFGDCEYFFSLGGILFLGGIVRRKFFSVEIFKGCNNQLFIEYLMEVMTCINKENERLSNLRILRQMVILSTISYYH